MSETNPNPDLFTTFERLETCHRTEVTEDNMHLLAQFFGWSVDYAAASPRLWKRDGHTVEVGAWIDYRGSRWNPEPLTQGWSPTGTFRRKPESAVDVAVPELAEESA